MACVHQFGILDYFDDQKKYNDYTPHTYNCISVNDDIINRLSKDLSTMKTYFHSFNRPELGLAYYGITIIPPESLVLFYDAVVSSRDFKSSNELSRLASKIMKATEEKKYMIHYGV